MKCFLTSKLFLRKCLQNKLTALTSSFTTHSSLSSLLVSSQVSIVQEEVKLFNKLLQNLQQMNTNQETLDLVHVSIVLRKT